MDSFVIGNTFDGKIVISFDKNKKPIRDYFYETNSNKFSVIKNKNIIIY